MLDLRLVRYFVAVADAGSVSGAARQLHTSQPSLSRQIARIERLTGVVLFRRTATGLQLTAAGEQLLPIARDLLVRAETAEASIRTVASGRLQRLVIAAPSTTLTDVIAPFIASFGPHDPAPSVRDERPPTVYGAHARGADLMIAATPPPPGLVSIEVVSVNLWAYVRHDDPWATAGQVRLEDLVHRPLLLLTQELRSRTLLDQALAGAGITLGHVTEMASAQIAQALAAAGRGVAVVSDDPRFDLVPLRILDSAGHPLVITLYAAWEPTHHAADHLSRVSARLAEFCRERYGPADADAGG